MKAMIFAAGYGTRLRPATDRLPKALTPVAGRPMIEYPLLLLRHYGIKEIIVNLHHLGEKIEAYLKDGEKLGLKISYSREQELLDTGGGLLQAKPFLRDGPFVVINSDVLIDLPLAEAIAAHRSTNATATLVLRQDAEADSYGAIQISADRRMQRFLSHERPGAAAAGPLAKYMFTGVQVLDPKIFDFMAEEAASSPFGITRVTYPKMVREGAALYGFPFSGFWQDLGTPERIREAEEKLARGEAKLHYLSNAK
jgi:NDP-sugar pyrophosphorylase family protein